MLEWKNVDKQSISSDSQNGVYIMKMNNDKLLKFGKSSNMLKTRQQYERAGNVQMICLFYPNMDKLESFVLNILVSFRIQKTDSNYLTEVLNIKLEILTDIVSWCISNIQEYTEKIPLCRTINTRNNTLTQMEYLVSHYSITELCVYLIIKHNISYCFPMEIITDNKSYFSYHLKFKDLYECINRGSLS